MSGVKTGVAPEAGLPIGVLAAPALMLIAGAAAAVGLSVMGVVAAGRGAAYLGKKAYTALDEQSAEMADKELQQFNQLQQQHLKKIEQYKQDVSKKLAKEVGELPSFGEDGSSAAMDYATMLTAQKVLADAIQMREAKEKKDGLTSFVSMDLQKLRQAIETKIAQARAEKKKCRENAAQKKGTAQQEALAEIQKLRDAIKQDCGKLPKIFSDKTQNFVQRAEMATNERALISLKTKVATLLAKAGSLGSKGRPLEDIWNSWREFALLGFLSNEQLRDFEKLFYKQRDAALAGQKHEVTELEEKKHTLFECAFEKFNKQKFAEECEDIQNAMKNAGYITVTSRDVDQYRVFTGLKADGKQAIFQRLKPDAKQTLSPFKSQIVDTEYKDIAAWDKAGKELLKELAGYGIEFNYTETSTHFKGRIITENIQKMILESLDEEQRQSVRLRIVADTNLITFTDSEEKNQQNIQFKPGMDISKVTEQLKNIIQSPQKHQQSQVAKGTGKAKQKMKVTK